MPRKDAGPFSKDAGVKLFFFSFFFFFPGCLFVFVVVVLTLFPSIISQSKFNALHAQFSSICGSSVLKCLPGPALPQYSCAISQPDFEFGFVFVLFFVLFVVGHAKAIHTFVSFYNMDFNCTCS